MAISRNHPAAPPGHRRSRIALALVMTAIVPEFRTGYYKLS